VKRALGAAAIILFAACQAAVPRTQVIVFIDAEPNVRAMHPTVNVVVNDDSSTGAASQRLDLTLRPGVGSDPEWPLTVALAPLGNDASRTYEIVATATTNDTAARFLARVRAISGYVPRQTRALRLVLSDACLGVQCAATDTCTTAGACVAATVMPGSLAPLEDFDASVVPDVGSSDGGVDAGVDAAAVADAFEAGQSDVGSTDASTTDSNTDAGGCAGLACVVISEVATHGSTAFDEFVELYNRGTVSADLSGCTITYYNAAGVQSPRATFAAGTTLASHHFYLATSAGYSGAVTPDMPNAWSSGLPDSDATIAFECGGVSIDELGYGAGASISETQPAPAIPTASLATASYERKAFNDSTPTTLSAGGRDAAAGNGFDSNDNSFDFVILPMRDPAASTSPAEP
jgi:hypothetical protein